MALLNRQEKEYYIKILSSYKSPRTIQNVLQSLFFDLEQGKYVDRYVAEEIGKILEGYIKKNGDARVRLWSYKIGCFLNSYNVVKAAKDKISHEVNPENIMWIISLVSANTFSNQEFTDFLVKKVHSLSFDHVKLACYLFGNRYGLQEADLIKLGNSNDKLILTWLETIHAYGRIAKYYNGIDGVGREFIEDLTMHDDDDISKYAVGSLWKRGDFSVARIKLDYRDHEKLNDKTKKWFYTSIWQDNIFINCNHEFVDHILSKFYLLYKCSDKVREGMARGISGYIYNPYIANRIIEWYFSEDNETVKLFLIKYMTRWQEFNKDYEGIVLIEKNRGDTEIKECIKCYQKILFQKGGKSMKIFIGSSKEAESEMDRIAMLIEKLGHSCILWNDSDSFVAGSTTLESLVDLTKRSDAAIFIFNGEDKLWYRETETLSVRDNVLLEYGIFLGAKGTGRAIFICKNDPKIATDLLGINRLDANDRDNTLKGKIKAWIEKL